MEWLQALLRPPASSAWSADDTTRLKSTSVMQTEGGDGVAFAAVVSTCMLGGPAPW